MPEAIKCGMPIKEFWYGDTRLFKAYQIAYYRSNSYNAWLQGKWSYIAFATTMANAFSKGSKSEFPEWKDPMEKYTKPVKRTNDNNGEHNNQFEWFANMLQRK